MDTLRDAGKPGETAALGLPLDGVQLGGRAAKVRISGFRPKNCQRKLGSKCGHRFVVEQSGTPPQRWKGEH